MVSMTPDYSKKVGLGVTPSPIPFLTPRPERRRTDSRGLDWTTSRQDKDREVNVQVLLRCRPLSDEEQRSNVPKVISCNELRREVTIVQNLANKHVDRVFAFDKVFGPKAQQRSIFDQAIVPIVKEVLEGFNCTVFAYGQTGAGKTYTMEGEMRNKGGDLPAEAGVIPRAVRQIFDTLEAQNADYSMRVTFLELYNEEITDLLAKEDHPRCSEDKPKKPISLMEDGKGSVIVRGLEEEVVYSANDIYNLLEHGAAKRRTADTLLNKRSSRSHSVFSITVHVKETVVGDEELIKCGKLNLVDLAGSENIYRSGAREGRAREAGEINKSLLTLGRVINALVEHSVHIPYRDSKLTRLLRDSLGGKTKTCIIATISPTALCLDETLSTLEYAYRAKSIKNKPEANQKISKAVLLKDLYLELERMKQDVRAARDKNGVYIPHERFAQDEAEKKERIERIDQMEIDLNLSAKQADKFRELYMTEQEQKLNTERELKNCKIDLDRCNTALLDLQEKHMLAITKLKEKELIISKLRHSENRLIERAKELCANLQNASEDISLLSAKIDQKNKMESENQSVVWMLGSQLDQRLKDLHKSILVSVSEQEQQLRFMEKHICSFLASKCDATKVLESRINQVMETYALRMEPLKELSYSLHNKVSSDQEHLKSIILLQTEAIENFLATAVSQAKEVLSDVKNSLNEQLQVLVFTAQKQEKGLERRLASVQEITKATTNFLNELHRHASTAMTILDNSEIEKSQYLATFENNFKEDVAREEKLAMQKIAEILSMLTSKKTAIVSKATRSIHCSDEQVRKRLQQEMSSIQHVAGNANDKLSKHMEEVESYFLEDAFSSAESRTLMENFLQECFNRVSCSGKQWENAQSSINVLNKTTISQTESSVKESICRNQSVHEEFLLLSSSMGAELDARAGETLAAVNESLILDHETRKELDSVSHSCLDQLKSIQENHGKGICDIQKKAEHCLQDDYLIDQHLMPQTRGIAVPSLASIEEMRTPLLEDLTEKTTSENKSKWGNVDKQLRQQLMTTSPNRTPLSSVN